MRPSAVIDQSLLAERRVTSGVHDGCPYWAVGMNSAVESSIGLPSISTNALRMLGFVTPPEVSSSLIAPAYDRDGQPGRSDGD